MQARPPADAFIGYGGIVIRKAVQEGADWFVTDFAELITEIR
jgi:phosphoserine phosphatase